jgi:hypothetical protein
VGSVFITIPKRVSVTGVSASGSVGTATVVGSSNVFPIGVQAVGSITSALVWGVINDNQTPNWTPIKDGNRYEGPRGGLFGFGTFGEVPLASLGFDDVPVEQWRTVNDGNTVVWVQIAT